MTLKNYLENLGISTEASLKCEFHSISKTLISFPFDATDEELILLLLGSNPSNLKEEHRTLIRDYLRKFTIKLAYCSRTDRNLFAREYVGLWDSLLSTSFDQNNSNISDTRLILIEHDAEIPIKELVDRYINLECILLVTRVSCKLELNCLIKKEDGSFVDLRAVNSGQVQLNSSDNKKVQQLNKIIYFRELFDQKPSWQGILPVSHNSYDDNIFENEHWNRAFRGQFQGRDSLIYQFYDFLGNRTLEGFNGKQDINRGLVLTGGSSVWCREQPFSWGIEGNLRKILGRRFEISNLAGCGETFTEEVQKVQHYLKYKGIPKAIVSYTGFNDINAIQYSKTILEHRRQTSVGFFSREYGKEVSESSLTSFIKRINFDLNIANYLAGEFNYKHYIFLQPSIFSSDHQYKLLSSTKCHLSSIEQLSRMRGEATPGLYLSWMRSLFEANPYTNLKLVDWSDLFDQCEDLMFYDWVHLSRAGCAKVSEAISNFVSE